MVLDAFLQGDATEHGKCGFLKHCNVHIEILLRQTPFYIRARFASKARFVYIYDSVSVILGSRQQPFHVCGQLLLFFGILLLRRLVPSYLFLFNEMLGVDLSKLCRIHMRCGKLLVETFAPVGERQCGLCSQRIAVDQPLDFVWLEESVAMAQYFGCFLVLSEPREQRRLLGRDLLIFFGFALLV